jgi:hypothetical protein
VNKCGKNIKSVTDLHLAISRQASNESGRVTACSDQSPIGWEDLEEGLRYVVTDSDAQGYKLRSPTIYYGPYASLADAYEKLRAVQFPRARIFEIGWQESLWPIGHDFTGQK